VEIRVEAAVLRGAFMGDAALKAGAAAGERREVLPQ